MGYTTVRDIHSYTLRHLLEWFPNVGTYEAFNYRLYRISGSFVALTEELVNTAELNSSPENWVVESLPIVLAGPRRSGRAKVATDMADKGFCASKDLYFYGVKLHCVGTLKGGPLPVPSFLGLAPASSGTQLKSWDIFLKLCFDFVSTFEQTSRMAQHEKIYCEARYRRAGKVRGIFEAE